MKDSEIAEILKKQDEEYKKLYEEHRKLDQTLSDINKNRYLSPEDEIEKKKLQKQKLLKKDRMAAMIRDYKKKTEN